MIKHFLKEYCLSFLEIIENKQRLKPPPVVPYIMMIVLYFQILGYILINRRYIFSSYEIKPIIEQHAAMLAYYAEVYSSLTQVSPGTFILYMTGKDHLTITFFFLIDMALLSYFLYVGLYTFLKLFRINVFLDYKKSFDSINQVLNLFLSSLWWVLFTPMCEINCGMMVIHYAI